MLLSQINKLLRLNNTGEQFTQEKYFLISTLVLFSTSYLTSVVRNLILYDGFVDQKTDHESNCKSSIFYATYSFCSYILTEFIPYIVIFALNFSNFRQIDK